jgi:hypothetical protein
MSRPIDNAYAASPNFFENLVIGYSPLGVLHIEFAEHLRKRFFRPRRGNSGVQTLSKQATQTKAASNARC